MLSFLSLPRSGFIHNTLLSYNLAMLIDPVRSLLEKGIWWQTAKTSVASSYWIGLIITILMV
jgi:hypothetical protein